MATNVYIHGISHRGFRILAAAGTLDMVKKGVIVQVNVDAATGDNPNEVILRREKDNFIKVSASNSTTVTVTGLTRYGITLGAHATAVLSSDGTEPVDGDTVTINDVTYRFKGTMAQANDVKRSGVSSDNDLDNLIAAVNQSGTPGVEYYAGTVAPTDVTAGTRTGTGATGKVTFTANSVGVLGDGYAKSETSTHLDWDGTGAFFTGGANRLRTGDDLTIDLTDGNTLRTLRRSYGRYVVGTYAVGAKIRGLQEKQNGFYVKRKSGTVTLTSNNTQATGGKIVTVGSDTYTLVTALTEAYASAIVSSDGTNPGDGDTITINDVTYRFEGTMAQANDVKVGANSDATLDSLVKAVNQTGTPGVDYFTGTVGVTDVTAGARAGTGATGTVTFTADTLGVGGNAYHKAETSAHLDFDGVGAVFTGGADPVVNEVLIQTDADTTLTHLASAINGTAGAGSTYSTGTIANADVTSSTSPSSHILTFTAIAGDEGEDIVVATDETTYTFSDTAIQGLIEVYKGVTVTVDLSIPFNVRQLRRHYKSYIEVP